MKLAVAFGCSLICFLILQACGGAATTEELTAGVDIVLPTGNVCCDEGAPFPQAIGVIQFKNNLGIFVQVEITELSAGLTATSNSFALAPGAAQAIQLFVPDCDWTELGGRIAVKDSVTVPIKEVLVQRFTVQNDCPPTRRISAGFLVTGLARAHFDPIEDPPVVGTDPVLYVAGPDTLNAVEAYAIMRSGTTGLISSTPLVDTLGSGALGDTDVVPVSAGPGPVNALYLFGDGGVWRTHWAGTNWGGLAGFGTVRDAVSYGGDSRSPGISIANGITVGFQEYDPVLGRFTAADHFPTMDARHLGNSTGDPVSAFVNKQTLECVVAMDEGEIWYHDRVNEAKEATFVTDLGAGSSLRRIRGANGMLAISNGGRNTVTLMNWNANAAAFFLRTFTGPPDPFEMDLIALNNGNTLLAVASDTTNQWWLGEIDPAGAEANSWEGTYDSADELADVVLIPGTPTYLAVAAKEFSHVLLVNTGLESPAGQ